MKKSFSRILVAALAVVGVLGSSSKANAALVIDFDNVVVDGGLVSALGGGQYSGSGIIFDTILYKDTTGGPGGTSMTLAGVQCGASTTSGGATAAAACSLSFNTATGDFDVVASTGLWGIGADLLPYTADRGGLLAGTVGANVLNGEFSLFGNLGPGPDGNNLFVGAGFDTKNAALLQFFGLPANTTFTFANTEIYVAANGSVVNADLENTVAVPEPATMTLLGLGLLAASAQRRRRAKQ